MCRETITSCVLDFPFSQNIYATLAPGESIGKDNEWSLFARFAYLLGEIGKTKEKKK